MRILALVLGVFLLLPGVCSLATMATLIPAALLSPSNLSEFLPLSLMWAFCLAVSYGGLLLIRSARRPPGPPRG